MPDWSHQRRSRSSVDMKSNPLANNTFDTSDYDQHVGFHLVSSEGGCELRRTLDITFRFSITRFLNVLGDLFCLTFFFLVKFLTVVRHFESGER